ncbi:fizzy-related protein homolog [Drosophila tropicalis]|uniref:fizzy-related protein homolog n=1 Tax=Drosophila tropicalis TaxID=46794 RepID=UPI0035AC0282
MFQPEYEHRLLGLGETAPRREELDLRYIPKRALNEWTRDYSLKEGRVQQCCRQSRINHEMANNTAFACILRNEFIGMGITSVNDLNPDDLQINKDNRLYNYGFANRNAAIATADGLSTVSPSTQKLLSMPLRPNRKVPKLPYKILDAPDMLDDYYLNLIDWSSQNTLGVGLGCSVYLWDANTSNVTRLCDLNRQDNLITSVSWHDGGRLLAVGTQNGCVSVWDAERQKEILKMSGHSSRVSALSWRAHSLTSGSHHILQRDTRVNPSDITRDLRGHRLEVCGLRWSPSGKYLASGGNDSRVVIWTPNLNEPLYTFTDHNAAVKALAWSPHKSGLLGTGGGSADGCLRFWNVLTGQLIECIDTGSPITNLAWSQNSQELVTTHGHGYPQIVAWRYPSMKQVVRLSGHSLRVVYLAVSPDNETIVTGSGDETLRFWNVFSKKPKPKAPESVLSLHQMMR